MNGIERESFKMKKIKLLKGGGIYYEAVITINTDGSIYEVKRKDDVPVIASDDLLNLVRDLKEKLLSSCRYMGIQTLVNSFEFKPRKDQREAVEKLLDILKSKTNVTGVHVSGQDQNEGIIISGKIEAENSSKVAINSPRMRFSSQVYGWEEEMEDQVKLIEDELYLYLYENKKAQLDAFGSEEQGGQA
jgi:hypothetical protein